LFFTGAYAKEAGGVMYMLKTSKPAEVACRVAPCSTAHQNKPSRIEKESVMSEFKNITIVKKANVYFEGKVTSRTVIFPDGSKKTLGIMLPGEYEFNTAEKELMEIFAGDLEVLLPGANGWKTIKGGEAFEVPAQSKFSLKIKTLTDYCCSFIN
jgi:purine/pyrimidine-nucleoside phosphorylase